MRAHVFEIRRFVLQATVALCHYIVTMPNNNLSNNGLGCSLLLSLSRVILSLFHSPSCSALFLRQLRLFIFDVTVISAAE